MLLFLLSSRFLLQWHRKRERKQQSRYARWGLDGRISQLCFLCCTCRLGLWVLQAPAAWTQRHLVSHSQNWDGIRPQHRLLSAITAQLLVSRGARWSEEMTKCEHQQTFPNTVCIYVIFWPILGSFCVGISQLLWWLFPHGTNRNHFSSQKVANKNVNYWQSMSTLRESQQAKWLFKNEIKRTRLKSSVQTCSRVKTLKKK